MTERWTDSLCAPLADALRGRCWNRVEENRRGGWLLLADEGVGDGVAWFALAHGETEPEPINILEDRRLDQARHLVVEWLQQGVGITLLGYKVGRRAIFLLDGVATNGSRAIAKVYRKSPSIPERWKLFPCRPDARWRVPAVLEWDADRRALLVEHCAGVSYNRRWLAGEGEPADGERIGELLEWMAATPVPSTFPKHGPAREALILGERLPVFERILQAPFAGAAELTREVAASLSEDPPLTPIAVHRDFHDKQILVDGDRGTLIDLDLAALGPPALDAGNIIAHLRLRHLKGASLPWQEIAGRIAEVTKKRVGNDTLFRWTASTLMRLALIYCRRRRGPELLENLLASTQQALERSGEWEGIL